MWFNQKSVNHLNFLTIHCSCTIAISSFILSRHKIVQCLVNLFIKLSSLWSIVYLFVLCTLYIFVCHLYVPTQVELLKKYQISTAHALPKILSFHLYIQNILDACIFSTLCGNINCFLYIELSSLRQNFSSRVE